MPQKRLAIISTHPIQYNAPLFQLLSSRNNIKVKVFYTWGESVLNDKYDPGFGKQIKWDIPLLEGYEYEFVENIAKNKGSHHFNGIDNPTLISEIKNWKADALLVYGWSFKSHLKAMRYFYKKIPVYFRGDSTLLDKQNPVKKALRNIFLRWVYRHIDIAFYVGTNNKAYFKKAGVKENKLIFAAHAINNQWFQQKAEALKEASVELRKQLNIGVGEIVFLYAGKLDENKNTRLLIKAFLLAAMPNTHLLIVGNGEKEAELKKDFEGESIIHFLPFQNQQNMPLMYEVCNVFVLPSISETWGLAINEAMACSRAILASDGCGCAVDLVKPGINGLVFKKDDMNDAAEKIKILSKESTILKKMGEESKNIIAGWSFQNICIAIENQVNQSIIIER